MHKRRAWILLSRAESGGMDRTATGPILRALGTLGIRCDHIDDGTGVNGVSPVLLTDERRFEGHAAIAAFLRHLTAEIKRLKTPSCPIMVRASRSAPPRQHLVVHEGALRVAAFPA